MLPSADDLTPEEVAARLRVPVKTVHDWLRDGKLSGYKAGHFWRVTPIDLDRFCRPNDPDDGEATAKPKRPRIDAGQRAADVERARRLVNAR